MNEVIFFNGNFYVYKIGDWNIVYDYCYGNVDKDIYKRVMEFFGWWLLVIDLNFDLYVILIFNMYWFLIKGILVNI